MLSQPNMNWINGHFNSIELENAHVQTYLEIEAKNHTVCPLCKKVFADYITVNNHLIHDHSENEIETRYSELEYILDPLKELRELEIMKRVENPEVITIGQFFGDILTSTHNQNVMLNIYGKQGMGKSNASMYIAYLTSVYVARKMGGKPDGNGGVFSSDPKDYFSMENVAVMTLKSIIPVLRRLDKKRFNIFILDDISGDYNARKSQTKENQEINKIITTFRDANCMVIITTVSDFLIDKVGRKLAHFQIEMNKVMFNHSMTIGKLKLVKENYQSGDTYFVFPVMYGVQYPRIAFERAPKEIADAYEARRNEIRKKFTSESLDKIENGDFKEAKEPKKEAVYITIAPTVNQIMIDEPGISVRAIAKRLNVHHETVKHAIRHLNGEE